MQLTPTRSAHGEDGFSPKDAFPNRLLTPSLAPLLQVYEIAMAHVITPLDQPSSYKDSQARVDRGKQSELLGKSTTLYVIIPTVQAMIMERLN